METKLTFYQLDYPEDYPEDKTESECLLPDLENYIKVVMGQLDCCVVYIEGEDMNELRRSYMNKFNDDLFNKKLISNKKL